MNKEQMIEKIRGALRGESSVFGPIHIAVDKITAILDEAEDKPVEMGDELDFHGDKRIALFDKSGELIAFDYKTMTFQVYANHKGYKKTGRNIFKEWNNE